MSQCPVVWLPGGEKTFSAHSSGLPTFLRSWKKHQESWWAGNWDRNFFFFSQANLFDPTDGRRWCWRRRESGAEHVFLGEESGWILRNLGWLLHVAASKMYLVCPVVAQLPWIQVKPREEQCPLSPPSASRCCSFLWSSFEELPGDS